MDEFLMNATDSILDDEAHEIEISASELLNDDYAIDDIAEITDEDIENCDMEEDIERDLEDLEDTDSIPDEIIYSSDSYEEDDEDIEDDISDIIEDEE